MALRRTRLVPSLSSPAGGVGAESQSSMISLITLGVKQAGKPSAGNPHAGFDVAGIGNRPTVRLVRHSQRKRGATDRLSLRGNRRQSSTLLMSGEEKPAGMQSDVGTAPFLDSTQIATGPTQAARFGRCWRRSFRLRCQALAEHADPNARIRAPTAGRLRFAFLTSPFVHGSPMNVCA